MSGLTDDEKRRVLMLAQAGLPLIDEIDGMVRRHRAATVTSVPVGYFVAPDAFGDVWIWRERGDYPVQVIGRHAFGDHPELWDYLACALPHLAPEVPA